MAFCVGLFIKTDLIIATSPQFFTAISGRFLSLFKRKPWIMEVRDLWPESIKSVGAMSEESLVYKMLERIELSLYKSAQKIVVVTDTFKKIITKKGISSTKIKVVKNGVLLANFKPVKKDNDLLKKLGLEDKFILGYIGTHGMAHALDFILKSAKKIDNPDVHFLLIGDGAMKSDLEKLAKELNLTNVTMLPFQPKSEIRRYIGILDVALVNLKKSDTFKSVIPSKIFENASMQKPILLGVEGESMEIINSYNAGIAFEPENEVDFLSKVKMLTSDKNKFLEYKKGCDLLALDFDRNILAKKMKDIITG